MQTGYSFEREIAVVAFELDICVGRHPGDPISLARPLYCLAYQHAWLASRRSVI
jgi:hypothetical protein